MRSPNSLRGLEFLVSASTIDFQLVSKRTAVIPFRMAIFIASNNPMVSAFRIVVEE